jgi:hypothetical protein
MRRLVRIGEEVDPTDRVHDPGRPDVACPCSWPSRWRRSMSPRWPRSRRGTPRGNHYPGSTARHRTGTAHVVPTNVHTKAGSPQRCRLAVGRLRFRPRGTGRSTAIAAQVIAPQWQRESCVRSLSLPQRREQCGDCVAGDQIYLYLSLTLAAQLRRESSPSRLHGAAVAVEGRLVAAYWRWGSPALRFHDTEASESIRTKVDVSGTIRSPIR